MNEWSQGIPDGITRDDVEQAIGDFDVGVDTNFGPSTFYDLVFEGRRYPPKAIIGLAARRIAGRTLEPNEFSGGRQSKCFRVLQELGFSVELKPGSGAGKPVFNRKDPIVAEAILESLTGDTAHLERVCEVLASAVERANSTSPGCWGITLYRDRIRLNVGRVQLVVVENGTTCLTVADELVSPDLAQHLIKVHTYHRPWYFRSLKSVHGYTLPNAEFAEMWSNLVGAFESATDQAAQQVDVSPFRRSHSPGVLRFLEEVTGRSLPDPAYMKGDIAVSLSTEQLVKLVRTEFPDWRSFDHAGFVESEINYKKKAIEAASDLLKKGEMGRLVQAQDWEKLTERLKKVAQRGGNLLYLAKPSFADLNILYDEKLIPEEYFPHLLDLLHGEGDTADRLSDYLEYVSEQELPNKWTFPTYFLFVLHPESELYVKPRGIKRFLRLLDPTDNLTYPPSADEYRRVREIAHALMDDLVEYSPQDMVDIQSFIWVCQSVEPSSSKLLSPDQRKTILEFVEEHRGADEWKDEIARRAGVAEDLHGIIHASGLLEGKNLEKSHLADIIKLVWKIQNLQAIFLPKLIGYYEYFVFFKDYQGTREEFAKKMAAERPDWEEGSTGHKGADLVELSKALKGAFTADSGVAFVESFEALLGLPGVGPGFASGVLVLWDPQKNALVNGGACAPFEKGGVCELAKSQTTNAKAKVAEFFQIPADAVGSWLRSVLSWTVVFSEVEKLIGAQDFLEVDYTLWRLSQVRPPETRFWKIAPGEGARKWEECRDNECIAIGWDATGDLTGVSRAEFEAIASDLLKEREDWTSAGLDQLWKFAREIRLGDRIVANRGTTEVIGIGTVTGPYHYDEATRYSHRLPVSWDDVRPRPVDQPGWKRTLVELSKEQFNQIVELAPPAPSVGKFWWVNQGESWEAESTGGYVWAQVSSKAGVKMAHHTNVSRLRPGDVVFHYAGGSIRGISVVSSPPQIKPRPGAEESELGHFAELDYELIDSPVTLEEIPHDLRTSSEEPFTRGGGVKQGYMFPLSDGFVRALKHQFEARLPVDIGETEDSQKKWMFQANVDKYHLESELRRLGPGGMEIWRVSRYREEVRPGDRVALWQSGRLAGVYGIAEISDLPMETVAADWAHDPSQTKQEWTVPIRVLEVLEEPVLKPKALEHPVLSGLQIFRMPQATNFRLTQEEWGALQDVISARGPKINPHVRLDDVSTTTGIDSETLHRWVTAIERKGQGIFYGPPGTGKTFVAEHIAQHFVGGGDGFGELVQFHPSYAYEDFIQGLRPIAREDGNLDYQLVPGRFLDFCRRAEGREGKCVLIIDEINRANLSRVFGELMYLLEYRNNTAPLAGGETLRVPENVRIIGTMNTADRSIALVDHALRRRFAFLPLFPDYSILKKFHEEKTGFSADGLIGVLRTVNSTINDPHYEVGISFFLDEEIDDHIEDIWRMEIEPYLEEYFFDRPETVAGFRWERVADEIVQ